MSALLSILAQRHRGQATVPTVAGYASFNQQLSAGGPSPRSWTCPTATVLLLLAAADNMTTRGVPSWDGVAMALVASKSINAQEVAAWALEAPATGARNLTFGGFAFTTGGMFNPILVAVAGGQAAGITVSTTSITGFSSPFSHAHTPGAAPSVLIDAVVQNGNTALAAAGPNTQIAVEANAAATGGASWRARSGAGPHSFSWHTDSTAGVAAVVVEVPSST